MSEELFQKAKDNTRPRELYMRNTTLRLVDDYEPKYDTQITLEAQHKRFIKRLESVDLIENENEEIKVFRTVMEFGLRIVDPQIKEIEDQDSEEAKQYIRAELTAEFIAEYQLLCDDLDQSALKEFAERNVTYHLWPYWREYVMSTCQRARLPMITIPTIQI